MNEIIKELADKSGKLMTLLNETKEEQAQIHDMLIRLMVKGHGEQKEILEPAELKEKWADVSREGSY
jgi:hypothetical protein